MPKGIYIRTKKYITSEATKLKIRIAKLGKKQTQQHKDNTAQAIKKQWAEGIRKGGWKHTQKWKDENSLRMKEQWKKGLRTPLMLGKKHSQETIEKIRKATFMQMANPYYREKMRLEREEEKSTSWKGDNVGYAGLHVWVKKHLGKPQKCEHCGRTDQKKYEWANKSHLYQRKLDDWLRLCTSCHLKYDKHFRT